MVIRLPAWSTTCLHGFSFLPRILGWPFRNRCEIGKAARRAAFLVSTIVFLCSFQEIRRGNVTTVMMTYERTSLRDAKCIMGSQIAGDELAPSRPVGFAPAVLTQLCQDGFVLVYLGGESITDLLRSGTYGEQTASVFADLGFMKMVGTSGWYLVKFGTWRVAPHIQPNLRVLEAQCVVQAHRVIETRVADFFPRDRIVTESRIPYMSHLYGSTLPVVMLTFRHPALIIESCSEREIAGDAPALWGFREMYRSS